MSKFYLFEFCGHQSFIFLTRAEFAFSFAVTHDVIMKCNVCMHQQLDAGDLDPVCSLCGFCYRMYFSLEGQEIVAGLTAMGEGDGWRIVQERQPYCNKGSWTELWSVNWMFDDHI